jgi:hypothetical protein
MRGVPLSVRDFARVGIHGPVLSSHALLVVADSSATIAAGDRVITDSTKATRCSQLPFVSGHSDCSREQDANAPSEWTLHREGLPHTGQGRSSETLHQS